MIKKSDHKEHPLWIELSEHQQEKALERYNLIEPLLDVRSPSAPLKHEIAQKAGITTRTIERWLIKCENEGLARLAPKRRSDRGKVRFLSDDLQKIIQGFYLEVPRRTMKAVHRKVVELARQQNFKPPSYDTIRNVCHKIPK